MIYGSNRLMESNPGAIRAFLAGWLEAVQFMRAHKDETVKMEAQLTGYPESIMAAEYDMAMGMFTDNCKFNPESLETLKRSFIELKQVDTPPDMSKLYTEAYLPETVSNGSAR
jgi:ABC-type nitrate/sulfonate/bicarbonate transport system substrate-binding protein